MVRWFCMGNGWLTEFQTSHTFQTSVSVLLVVYCKTRLALHAVPRFGMQIAQKGIWSNFAIALKAVSDPLASKLLVCRVQYYYSSLEYFHAFVKFFIYKEIQSGTVAKSYLRKDFLIYEEKCKYFPIFEEAVSHIRLCNCSTLNFLIWGKLDFLFYQSLYTCPTH